MIERLPDENELDFHKRIVLGKLVDKTVDDDYSELAEKAYGEKSSSDHCRKMMYGSRYTIDLYERFFESLLEDNCEDEILDKIEMANIELKKERIKLNHQRTALNKLINKKAQSEELLELFEDAIKKIDAPILKPEIRDSNGEEEIVILLSDLHVGANISNNWCVYNTDVLKLMLEEYISKIIDIQKTHRVKNCVVACNGDLINGSIHKTLQIQNKETITQQIVIASELISQFLIELDQIFEKTRVCFVPGNHSRVDKKNEALKDERLDTLIEDFIKIKLSNFDTIVFDDYIKPDITFYAISILGKTYLGCHGDYDNSDKIAELEKFYGEPVYGIISAHRHHNSIKNVRGKKLIQGGSFVSTDDYTIQKRIFGQSETLVLVCDKDGLKCSYDVLFESDKVK